MRFGVGIIFRGLGLVLGCGFWFGWVNISVYSLRPAH